MDEYIWNECVDYLKRSRQTMWNADYMEFLAEKVWRIRAPVDVVDFGCGTGFLGAMLLPLLPAGSTYTGIDKGRALLEEAGRLFSDSPYPTNFIEADLADYRPARRYDIAICQAVLQHIPESVRVLEKMRDSVRPGGRVICMECDRNIANASLYFDSLDYERLNNLGILQKLWLRDLKNTGSDHTIGMKIPVYMQQIGLKDIGVRLNDRVNFINAGDASYPAEYDSFAAGGWGGPPKDKTETVQALVNRGLTEEEAAYQFDCEAMYDAYVRAHPESARIVHALSLVISFGTVE